MSWKERSLAFQAINNAPMTAQPGIPFDESDKLRGLYEKILGGLVADEETALYPFMNLGTSSIEVNDYEFKALIRYINKTKWQTLEMEYTMKDFIKRVKE